LDSHSAKQESESNSTEFISVKQTTEFVF